MDFRDERRANGDSKRFKAKLDKAAAFVQRCGVDVAVRNGELHEYDPCTTPRVRERSADQAAADPSMSEFRRNVHTKERRLVLRFLTRLERNACSTDHSVIVESTKHDVGSQRRFVDAGLPPGHWKSRSLRRARGKRIRMALVGLEHQLAILDCVAGNQTADVHNAVRTGLKLKVSGEPTRCGFKIKACAGGSNNENQDRRRRGPVDRKVTQLA